MSIETQAAEKAKKLVNETRKKNELKDEIKSQTRRLEHLNSMGERSPSLENAIKNNAAKLEKMS